MIPESVRRGSLLISIVVWAVLTFVVTRQMGGELLLLLAPFATCWLIYCGVVAWRKPDRRRMQLAKVAVCLVALSMMMSGQWYRHLSACRAADGVVARLQAYRRDHGAYPPTLAAVGLAERSDALPQGLSYDLDSTGAPSLVYFSTFAIFDVWDYNFAAGRWDYLAD